MIPTASRSLLMRSKKAMIVNTKEAEERVRKEHAERIKADAVSFDKSKVCPPLASLASGLLAVLAATNRGCVCSHVCRASCHAWLPAKARTS